MLATAQTQPNSIEQQANQQIQRDQQRRSEQQKALEEGRRERTRIDSPTTQPLTPVEDEGPCFVLQNIAIEGAYRLSIEQKKRVVEPLIGQCVGRPQVNQLLQRLTKLYFDAGFVTSRAYISQQNIADGALVIQIIEGELESLQLNTEDSSISLHTAFPNLEGKRLNLRDLEQGLEHINRLGSCEATMGLLPGSYLGASVVEIDAECGNPFALRLGRNNSGQASTGEQQQSLLASVDNPLGLNDHLYLSYQTDTKKEDRGVHSESLSGHWDVPLGYWLFSLNASRFEYTSLVEGSFTIFETTGISTSQSLVVERMIHRDQDSKTKIISSLTRKHTENYIEKVLIDTSSRVLAIAGLALQHEQFFTGGAQLISRIGYHQGLDRFGSQGDDETETGRPQAQFNKYTFTLDYTDAWRINSTPVIWQSTFSAQQTNDELFGSEQLSIGSEYTVRGYKDTGISGNTGAYWRNSLGVMIKTPWGGDWFQYIKPSIGLDAGLVRNTFYDDGKYAKLKGASLGLQLGGQYFSAGVTYARAIDSPDYLQIDDEYWHFSVQIML